MSEPRRCPQCDAEIPVNSPIGLCPRCLLKAGNDSQSVANSAEQGPTKLTPPGSGFIPPTVEELAPLFPQLEILELLGKGGMGAVYKARQPGLDRLVAVKILPPEISHDPAFAERFQREARALARLSHPHIVAVYDFGVVGQAFQPDPLIAQGQAGKPDLRDGLCYIVMEFVDGANLRQTIKTGTLTSAEALAIVPQICEALQFAHDEGIVHRDIKPENILIDKRGRVKIADFGLAKLLGQDASDHSLTATHQVMGTLRYMAPEQMQGSREVDHRADIYSLGVVFYELLTGELPMGRFAPPSKKVQIDVRLDEIVLRALEQEPEQRYQHASEVKTDVETISRESQSPNFAAQNPALRDERTARAEPAGLPFEIAGKVHWGLFGEVHGKLRLGRNAVVVEFEVRSLFSSFRSGLKEVSIPFDDLESVNWDGWDLTLHTKSMRALAEIPNSSLGQVAFDLSMTDVEMPGGISEPVKHFLACLPPRLAGKSASVASPVSEKGAATEPRHVQGPADCLLLAAGIAFVTACGVALWLGVSASLGRDMTNLTNPMIRGNLTGMSIGLAIYSAFVGVAGLMLRRLRARLFVLLVAVIVGLFFPAVIALNVVMELRNIPVWPVVIPLWLGMPAALWVVVTLFRDDVRRAFDAADKQRAEKLGTGPVAWVSTEPRFSRFAIAGAVWALFGLLAVIPTLYFIGLNRVWNGTAMPTDVIHSEPPLVFSIFMGALLAIGSGAPIGTTIYGGIAIGHIKRSGGKIIGLPLAVADVLFFPLLVLSGLIAALVARVGYSMAPHPNAAAVSSAGAFGVLVALVVCFFVARAVWRAIVRHDKPVDQPSPTSPGEKSGEPGGVSPRTGDEQVRGLTPMTHQPLGASPRLQQEPDASAYRLMGQRPKLVPVLATFNLVGAIVLMLVSAMEQPTAFAESVPQLWQVWETVDVVLGFAMAAGMFAASIGLFLWKPWARKLTLGVCVFSLAAFVFDAPYLARFVLPDFYAEVQHTLTAEGVDPDLHDLLAMGTVIGVIVIPMLVALLCLIGQLVYFSRPRVVAAFESQGERYGKFIEWLCTGAGAVVGVLCVFGPLALLLGITALFHSSSSSGGSAATAQWTFQVAGPHVEVLLNGQKLAVTDGNPVIVPLRPGDYETIFLKGNLPQKRVYEFAHAGDSKQVSERDADAIWIKGPITLEFESRSDQPTVADFTAIQGRWTVVAQVKSGGFLLEQQRGQWIEFARDIMRSDLPQAPLYRPLVTESRFAIDSAATPRHFDMLDMGAKGIYRLDGDTLTLAVADAGQPRPTEFASRSGSLVTLTLCRRATSREQNPPKADKADATNDPVE